MANIEPFENFIGGYNVERSIQIDNQRAINLYVFKDTESPDRLSMASLPGLTIERTFNDSPFRPLGAFSFEGDVYFVVGTSFYRNTNFIGNLSTAATQIWWSTTATQVTFTDGSLIYVYKPSTGVFTIVTTGYVGNPGVITSINGRVIVPILNTNTWYVSAENDATSFDLNRYDIFQLKPDLLMGSATVNNRMLLIGQIHTEPWVPVADVGIPLERDNNSNIDYGTWASGSIVSISQEDATVAIGWLARDRLGGAFFVLSEGTSAEKISTPSIDILLQTFSRYDDCYGYSYRIDGHIFIEWHFKTANYSLVFDATVRKWSERQMLDGSYFVGNCHAALGSTHYVGSRVDGTLYKMSSNYLQYYNGIVVENIHRQRIGPLYQLPGFVKHQMPYFEVKFEAGYIPPNITPTCWLQTSRDGDAFNNALASEIGETGQTWFKTYWRGLGTQETIIHKIDIYDPIRCYILGAAYSVLPCSA